MKRLLLVCLLLLWAVPVHAAYTCSVSAVGGQSDGDLTKDTTAAFNSTGADLIFLGVSRNTQAEDTITVSDTVGGTPTTNTWTAVPLTAGSGTNNRALLYYTRPVTTGASHIVVWDETRSSIPAIAVLACSGSAGDPLDTYTSNSNTTGATLATGTITPAADNEVVVSVLSHRVTSTITIDSSFSTPVDSPFVNNVHMGVSISYLVQTTATGVNPTWTKTSGHAAALTASFRSTGGQPCTGVP